MSRISQETLLAITARVSAADIIGRYVQLKKQGRELVGLCPFHAERTSSFSVNPEKGLWHCYGCGEGGSIFTFLEKIEGLSFVQAAKKLADEVGIEVVIDGLKDEKAERRELLLELLERAALFYSELLLRSPIASSAREYLAGRGISLESMQKFRLGWAPASGDALARKLLQAGYEQGLGVDTGLLRQRGSHYFDMLKARLVFPITGASGKVIAFGGRLLGSEKDASGPKYLNTPESELYQKRENLYGLSFHRGSISRTNEAMVMEGYLDVIAVSQAGFPLSVASLGTALTESQCRLLARYTKRVHLFYDADRAGRSATEKAIGLFEQTGLQVHVALMEQGQDPDSVIRERGAEAFQAIKNSTVPVVDYLIGRKSQEYDLASESGKEDFLKSTLSAIAKVQDEAKRDRYAVKVAGMTYSPERVVVSRVQVLRKAFVKEDRKQKEFSVSSPPTAARLILQGGTKDGEKTTLHAEERLVALLIQQPKWISRAAERIQPDELSRVELRPLLKVLLQQRSIERPLAWVELGESKRESEGIWARLSVTPLPESSDEDMERLIKDIKVMSLEPRYEYLRRSVLEGLKAGEIGPESIVYQEYVEIQQRLKGTRDE